MAQKARTHGPGDLDFTDGNHGFTAQLSACIAMRLLQAVGAARQIPALPGCQEGATPRAL